MVSHSTPVELGFTCLIADDHQAIRDSLTALLRSEQITVVGVAETGVQALELLVEHRPTVILLDQRMPDLSGLEVARQAAELAPDTRVIMYTSEADPTLVRRALDIGVRGVVPKDAPLEHLLEAIAVVTAGRSYVDPMLDAQRSAWGELQTEIFERGRSDAALAQSEERAELVQSMVGLGTWSYDIASGSTTWSQSLRELMGVDADAPSSYAAFIELVHTGDRDRVSETIAKVAEVGGSFEVEYQLCRPDGEVRWLMSRGRAVDTDGKPARMIGVALDVTDRHEAEDERTALEDQLQEAQKLEAVGRLAGGIAHDFNNLLLSIRAYGELAISGVTRGDDPTEDLGEILTAADRAAALTGQLLAFSRRQVLNPEVMDLNSVVADTNKLLRPLIGENVELSTIASSESVCVSADRSQLEQVLANLAINARDSMPDGGRLTIEVSEVEVTAEHGLDVTPGPYALVAVSDTGCGMDAETSSQIFEPFFTTKADGTGLGLATVHGIVRQSGGSIWLCSKLGQGTTFKIYLPLVGRMRAAAPLSPTPQAAVGAGETILLVEDDSQVRTPMRRVLEGLGYRVLAARDGEEAFTLADDPGTPIDLLLTDLVMPGMGGREIAARFRGQRSDAAVLYMSGYTSDVVIRGGRLEPGTEFLQKPFGSDELARQIRALLDSHERNSADRPAILLVDDEEPIRRLAQRLLKELGHDILVAADADEALAIARSETVIDLLITDVVMPDSDGFDLAERFVGLSPGTRVLFMSGHATERDLHPGILDTNDILLKPFSGEAIADRIRTTLAAPGRSEAA